jgi:L-ascorbate metabolism protein UlaG (beta-lactamase superfamily)
MKTFGKQAAGERLERMRASPLWSGESFRNVRQALPDLRDGPLPRIGEFLCGPRRVPKAPLPTIDPRPSWAAPPETGFRVTWLGHSTVLLEIDGVRILTDPVWGERASPIGFAGPKRFQPIPVSVANLPHVDLVIVSHDHYDHLDYPTILELARTPVPFVTSLGVGAHLEAWGVPASRITELDWWESAKVPRSDVTVTATPSQHFSGRGPGMRNTTLWSGFAIRSARHSCFFSGDTGLTTEYEDIKARLGPFDLVMLEVGAFHPSWGDIHLGPERALEAYRLIGGGAFLPVHWGTFNLAVHAWDEPAEALVELGPKRGAHLLMPRLGEAVELSRPPRLEPWWRKIAALERPGDPIAEPTPEEREAAPLVWPID